MKNAEKFKEIFKEFATEVWAFPEKDFLTWLNAEYEEPTTKNDLGVDCISRKAAEDITWHDPSYTDPLNILTEVRDKIRELPSVTPQLSVPEITALAEWIEKLTKASVEAIPKADYENRLKADLVAVLTDLQLKIEELNHKGSNCYRDGYTPYSEGLDDCKDIIQQKIDKLKEAKDGENNY